MYISLKLTALLSVAI